MPPGFCTQRLTTASLVTFARRYGLGGTLRFFLADLMRRPVRLETRVDGHRVSILQPMEPWAFHHAVESWPKLVRLAREATRQRGSVILDVGANIGVFARLCLTLDPTARVYCFEPGRAALQFLRRNLKDRATIVPVAMADQVGELVFHESVATQSSSLLPPAHSKGWTSYKVEVGTLAEFLDREPIPAGANVVLKVDVQGTEGKVIAGLGEHLAAVSTLLLESTWLDEGSIRVAVELIDSGWSCEVAHTVQGGADLILQRPAPGPPKP